MAKSKSSRFFGLPSKCKCGLSRAVLPRGELGNGFTGVQVDLGGDPVLLSISVSYLVWNLKWGTDLVACVRLSMDSAGWEEFRGTLLSEEEMEWSWFADRTHWTACSSQNRDWTVHLSTRTYFPGFQGELFSTGNLWDSSRILWIIGK